jgi:hypothetical protein
MIQQSYFFDIQYSLLQNNIFNSGSIAHASHKIINTATTVYSTSFTLKGGFFYIVYPFLR